MDYIKPGGLANNTLQYVEKRGNDESGWCYYHNVRLVKYIDGKKHHIDKKYNIMPSDYFKLLDMKDPERRTLRVNRLVMIDYNHYYTLDYYPDINGAPCLLIVKKGTQPWKDKKNYESIESMLPIYREVTNEPEYAPENLSRINYVMNQKDKEETVGKYMLPEENRPGSAVMNKLKS